MTSRLYSLHVCFVAATLTCLPALAHAQQAAPPAPEEHDATALAKATQNPVGDLVSLPFQFNFNNGGDLGDRTLFNLNFQPVIPFSVSTNWNLIARTIIPVNSIPSSDGTTSFSGVGDIQEELFFTPKKPGAVIWGVGSIVSLPTSTIPTARTGSWGLGPAGVVLKVTGPWVLGGLVTQTWTFQDDGTDPKVDSFLLQPFVNYNFGKGWALAFGPNITANWEAPSGQEWTIPVGLGISRTTVLGTRPIQRSMQYSYNAKRPDGSAASLLRIVVSLLYPTRKH